MEPNTNRIKSALLVISKIRSADRKKKLIYAIYAAVVLLLVIVAILAITGGFSSKHDNQPQKVADNPVVREYRNKLPQLKEVAQQKPNDATARSAYAQALYVTGDKKTAKNEYEAAVVIDPKNASTRNNLGNVYRDLKEYDSAVVAYRKAFELEPTLINAYVNLATLQAYTLKKSADAVDTYKLAISKNGQSTELLLLLGGAYEQNKQSDLAVSTYRTVLQKDPQNETAKRSVERLIQH